MTPYKENAIILQSGMLIISLWCIVYKNGDYMTMDEARALVTQLNLVFDIVRFVDVRMMQEYTFAEDGQFIGHPYHCYNVWKKKRRCENCISAKAYPSWTYDKIWIYW